jgi:anti-sigma regulatory factor (Ser/Thr protein kinase)
MMLWEALGIQSPFPEKRRQPRGRYHPVAVLENRGAIDQVAADLASLFSSVCAGARTIDAVQTMLRELIDNCYSHSAVEDGLYGVICAQVWGGGRKAQIALSDSGVGIRASLNDNALLHERLEAENSCAMATEFGVTGKPGRGHSGYGLHVARGLLTNNNGMLYVRSGSEAFCLSQNLTSAFCTNSIWNGTLVVIEWDLDKPVDISDVYKNMPLPEGMNDDDFFD